MCRVSVLEAGSLESRCQQGRALSGTGNGTPCCFVGPGGLPETRSLRALQLGAFGLCPRPHTVAPLLVCAFTHLTGTAAHPTLLGPHVNNQAGTQVGP